MKFEKEYKRLNLDQRKAVDALDGPVLVIAGPGTGKTQLLGMRVANILTKTDTDPANILCLTFTNKAATNMRDRLLSLIGPAARDVTVKTFHSFAAELMNLYPDHFWSGAPLSTAPDAVQLEVIQDILTTLPLDHPLASKFAGAFTAISDVQNALKLVKEAGLTPDKLRALIQANVAFIDEIEKPLAEACKPALSAKKLGELYDLVADLPDQPIDETVAPLISLSTVIKEALEAAIAMDDGTNKTINTGKWKKRFIQTVSGEAGMWDERKRNAWWLALADVYEKYRETLHTRGYYDYADMLVEVIRQLEKQPEMLAGVQERFLYVLIDEFQDTNAAQLRLARLVADHHTSEGKPNLMAVGDDDQSIFKFNGAELNNLLSFRRMYPTTKRFVLKENYRSTQAVLDTSKKIIEQSNERLVNRDSSLVKELKAVTPPKNKGTIKHISYPTSEHARSGVAKLVKSLNDKNDGSIAVLARGHNSLQELASILLNLGVPLHYEQQSNVLDHEAVMQICTIAELTYAIQSGREEVVNELLATTLRHPMWGIEAYTLWQLALDNYLDPHWLASVIKNPDLSNIGNWLLWLSREATQMPIALLMEYIIGLRESEHMLSPVRGYFASKRKVDNDYLHALSAIRLLRSLVDEFSYNKEANLADFIRFIELNRANKKIIADESPFVTDEKAVQLLTVHKAKGLEFDYVVVIDAMEDIWKPRSGGRKPPANLPLQPYGDDYDDYVRLMFVAATRARHSLIFTSHYMDHAGKEVLAAPFVRTTIESEIVTPEKAEDPIAVLEQTMKWPRLNSDDEKVLLKSRLETLSLNVTSLLNFLDVPSGGPAYYFERNILRLPDSKSATLSHGTAMHYALEIAQKLVNTDQFTLEQVLESYEQALRNEHLPKTEFNRYLKHGHQELTRLFEGPLQLTKGSFPEQKLTDIRLNDTVIGGKLDRVDVIDDKTLVIVDYKTGAPLASFITKDNTKAVKAWKARMQLIFYALLARETPRYRDKNVEGRMIYLEAPTEKDFSKSYWPSTEEIARLEMLIAAVWKHTLSLDFPDTGKYSQDYQGIVDFEDDLIAGKI